MSTLLMVVGWFIIAAGAILIANALIGVTGDRGVGRHRKSRATSMREALPDVLQGLSCIAFGVAAFSLLWRPGTAMWWLGRTVALVVSVTYLASRYWVKAFNRRRRMA